MTGITVVDHLLGAFKRDGVTHVFGVPGGGSSLDLIRSCADHHIEFVLTRTEAAAVIMAAVSAELTGTIGVAIITRGPGTASAANGVAHASLDRAPVFVISDGWSLAASAYDSHQMFDQRALMEPLVKAHSRLEGPDLSAEIMRLLAMAKSPPPGPVYIELTGENARREVAVRSGAMRQAPPANAPGEAIAALQSRMARARRPVVLLGLETRAPAIAGRVRRMVEELGCPVLTTYKAKGVVPDAMESFVGTFTGGTIERDCIGEADLIVMVGLDPVELIGQPWPFATAVVEIAERRHPVHYVEPEIGLHQPVAESLDALAGQLAASDWTRSEIGRHREAILQRLDYVGASNGLTPDEVIDTALEMTNEVHPRITVDAGAHMFSAMGRWPCRNPYDALISNGLATMAFALPAAIASALTDQGRPVLAFTGDGGLMMCAGELSTAAQYRCPICIVVFNDACLSLIGIKQQARQLPKAGVEWPAPDFAMVAKGFGVRGFKVNDLDSYRDALRDVLSSGEPGLIDVAVDPTGYPAQSQALRG